MLSMVDFHDSPVNLSVATALGLALAGTKA
jgi:hypothetical protein